MAEVDKLHGWLPKIIHQTYADRNIPAAYRKNIEQIKRLCPGWEYRFYDNGDVRDYIAGNFPGYLKYYDCIDSRYGAARADFFRYLVIYKEGGVYLDLKSTLSRSLDEVLLPEKGYPLSHWKNGPDDLYAGYGLLAPFDDNSQSWPERGEFQQWFIVSPPGHPFLRKTIERVCQNIENYSPLKGAVGRAGVLNLTGPIAYTQAIVSVMDTAPHAIIDAEDDLGLIYSFLQAPRAHEAGFKQKHYSCQKVPIVKPWGIKKLAYYFRVFTVGLKGTCKRIEKSVAKRLKQEQTPM